MSSRSRPSRRTRVSIDPENPWLGLFSYSEETRAYFHGRDEEAGRARAARAAQAADRAVRPVRPRQDLAAARRPRAAAARRRLSARSTCASTTRPIRRRLPSRSSRRSSAPPPRPVTGRGRAPRSRANRSGSSCTIAATCCAMPSGRTLLPLLIFDQFEEIFTLAQADDAGRLRAKQFLDDLADLVENRPPAALESAARARRRPPPKISISRAPITAS